MSFKLKNPLIVALDLDDLSQINSLVSKLKNKVGAFKLGPRLIVRYGENLIKEISQSAPVFVDNKYFDIPNTMLSAVETTFNAGASLATIHALAGPDAMKELAQLENKLNQIRPFKILAVTILTSFSEETLSTPLKNNSISTLVNSLVSDVSRSGLSGIVSSVSELSEIRKILPNGFFVTPGIRLNDHSHDDQKRVDTPQNAISLGASAIVVGRPIVMAKDPEKICEEILSALQK